MLPLKERTRRSLTENIDRMRGPKALVIDPTLSGPLGLIAEKQLLKDHGVEKTYHLKNEPLETDQRRIMYLVREKISNMKMIADHIKYHQQQRQKLEYFVCMVPRKTLVCERVLEEEGVYGEVQLGEFDLDFIPFEDDLISMEIPDGFRDVSFDATKLASRPPFARPLIGLSTAVRGRGRPQRHLLHGAQPAPTGAALWRPHPAHPRQGPRRPRRRRHAPAPAAGGAGSQRRRRVDGGAGDRGACHRRPRGGPGDAHDDAGARRRARARRASRPARRARCARKERPQTAIPPAPVAWALLAVGQGFICAPTPLSAAVRGAPPPPPPGARRDSTRIGGTS